jgi:dihydrolipoamide dehydrogenase
MAVRISGSRRVEADKVLVCVGRRPNTAGIGLEELGIVTDNGSIPVDGSLRTAVPDIYAIGDCVKGPMLAHRASYDGMLACDNMTGNERKADYSNIPSCIWTDPEIASVGLTEEAARAAYPEAKAAKFPYLGSGKAYLEGETEGFVKIVGTPRGDLLGVEIFGRDACNLIGEATLAKASGMNIKDWSLVVHGHPTLSEILQEAAQAFCGRGIHGL